ncbi:SDR family NAD(P)-dependent oxidoreductase [Bifidobacterium tsurumiense]|uniref:NAD-dependent epimerase/dehydratase n=1 Tax=Bifidobacterium tsurumiense TaxID=356829 RepID=A0A087EK44_9BIFI|nr:SDR family NAD(P)-dependent oxidoreductase [Bifidobacterium tsurumiense]KFJ08145.1 NAD-dependent epimerase/dehydratase [Bifidobacterium tsurumiense]MDY4678708.1 SDR family NAD(P)-dependent oxidoreductase [Bifidobacterium tsurumiense]MSS13087.1 SDR family NAD(P)-dependent oxidoreductase [Bifidobacterium tsurumiense]
MSIHQLAICGATGTIGREAVRSAVEHGLHVRVLTRREQSARQLFSQYADNIEIVTGDLTDLNDVMAFVQGADGVIMTHGAPYGDERGYKAIDFGAVANVVSALSGSDTKIALMTSIGTSHSDAPVLAYKRKGEEALRASGLPYFIVRPGWFERGASGNAQLMQGDRIEYGQASPSDVGDVLVEGLLDPAITAHTCEVFTQDTEESIAEQLAALHADA